MNQKTLHHPANQTLRFTPYAWSKLLYLRDLGSTEIGAFGVFAPDDLLLVIDLQLIKQRASPLAVVFDDEDVADFIDDQVDQGIALERCTRCWIHTHPGQSAEPSTTDEATFQRVFGVNDWSIMFIISRGGQTYARVRFRAGPGGQMLLPVEVDWQTSFAASNQQRWQEDYRRLVHPLPAMLSDFPAALHSNDFIRDDLEQGQWPDDLAFAHLWHGGPDQTRIWQEREFDYGFYD